MKRRPIQILISKDQRFVVDLSPKTLRAFNRWCLLSQTTETGGILLGNYDEKLQTAQVASVTGPPPDSSAGSTWFERGTRGLQTLVKRHWKSHGHFYLGEWHFHPGGSLLPSPTDITQMRQISQSQSYCCPEPLLIIVGQPIKNKAEGQQPLRCFVFPRREEYQELLPNAVSRLFPASVKR